MGLELFWRSLSFLFPRLPLNIWLSFFLVAPGMKGSREWVPGRLGSPSSGVLTSNFEFESAMRTFRVPACLHNNGMINRPILLPGSNWLATKTQPYTASFLAALADTSVHVRTFFESGACKSYSTFSLSLSSFSLAKGRKRREREKLCPFWRDGKREEEEQRENQVC